MAVRGLRHLVAGTNIGGMSDRESLLAIDENYLLEAINLQQVEKGVWETRRGFTELTSLVSPTGEPYTSQFDYQSTDGIREHLGVVGKNITVNGVSKYPLTSSARGHWILWSINNVVYYLNGIDTVRYDGTGFRSPGFAAPSTVPSGTATTGGSLAVGDYRFRVTFVGDVSESSPSEPTGVITVGAPNNAIALTSIPTGPTGTKFRNIWRTRVNGSAGEDYYYDFTITDNTTTTGTSTHVDSDLGERAEFDNNNMSGILDANNPPTNVEIYNNHLFVWGHLIDRLSFSKLGNPESFGGDDFIDFPGKRGDVTGGIIRAINYRDRLYIFRQDSIYVLLGNNRDDFVTSLNSINFGNVGAIAPDSFQIIDGYIYFLAEDGPYVFDGANPPRYIGGNTPSIWDPYHLHTKLNQQRLNQVQSVYYRSKKQWWLAVPEKNMTELSAIYIYHHQSKTSAPDTGISVGAWSKFESCMFPINDITVVEGTSGNKLDVDRILLANDDTDIFEYDSSATDDGDSVYWRWTSVAIDFNSPMTEKRWLYFTPFLSEAQWGATMTVEFLFDGLGLNKKVYVIDLGSELDASALWGQMLWNGEMGFWGANGLKPVIKPIPINFSSKILHVMMRGTTRVKIHGYDIAGVPQQFRDTDRGTIRAQVRI